MPNAGRIGALLEEIRSLVSTDNQRAEAVAQQALALARQDLDLAATMPTDWRRPP